MQAVALAERMKRAAVDVCQAYLHAKRDKSEWIPVRYPDGPPRDAHRDPKTGEERFAILKGNLYGDPNSARLWQKELFEWIESLDGQQSPFAITMSGTEGRETTDLTPNPAPGSTPRDVLVPTTYTGAWTVNRMMYEPCLVKLTLRKTVIMSIHTDDCDVIAQDMRDASDIMKLFQTRYGISVCDPSYMLGIFREEFTESGERRIKMCQPSYVEKIREEFSQHILPAKSDPAEPFPVKTFLQVVDNNGKPVEVDADESKEVLQRGYMNLVGGLLWAGRNTTPAMLTSALNLLTALLLTG